MERSKTDRLPSSKSLPSCAKQSGNRSVSNRFKTKSQPSCSYKTECLPSANKTKVVKTFIRNPTVKSKLSVNVPVQQNLRENASSSSPKETEDPTPSCSSVDDDCDLKVPSLCTALRIADNIVTAALESKSSLLCDLAASSKASANKKAVSKVNFPLEQHLYKDLVNLQITDDDIAVRCTKSSSKDKGIGKKKDPVPKLSDFYVPSFDEEITAPPSPLKLQPEKIKFYDGHSVINRMKTWEAKHY